MRSLSLITFLSFLICSFMTHAYAETVKLDLVGVWGVNAKLNFHLSPSIEVHLYLYDDHNPALEYSVYVYSKGDCSNFSDPFVVSVINQKNQIRVFNDKYGNKGDTQSLIDLEVGGIQRGRVSSALDDEKFVDSLHGKVFVLHQINTFGDKKGAAVACAIYP